MGWWGCGVMEGDAPLDEQSAISKVIGNIDEVMRYCREGDKYSCVSDKPIRYQVAGVMLMERGAHIPAEFRKEIIANCDDSASWNNSREREEAIRNFIRLVHNYGEVPTEVPSKGLMQVFAEVFSEKGMA